MSTLVVDTLTGKSTATTLTIGSTPVVSASANSLTIRGEGSNQTSIQQGLCKCWADSNAGAAADDSFNLARMTDNGTGDTYLNFTNNMANLNYSGWSGGAAISLSYHDDQATNRQRHRAYSDLSSVADGSHRYAGTAGDLA